MYIIIRSVERRHTTSPAEFVRWVCEVFGLSGDSNGNTLDQQILEKLIIASKLGTGISSSEIKPKGDVARSTVIYHLNRLMDAGLVVKKGRKYHLRGTDMASAIREIEYDLNRELTSMQDAAAEFDHVFSEQMRRMQMRQKNI